VSLRALLWRVRPSTPWEGAPDTSSVNQIGTRRPRPAALDNRSNRPRASPRNGHVSLIKNRGGAAFAEDIGKDSQALEAERRSTFSVRWMARGALGATHVPAATLHEGSGTPQGRL